jgi:hypothetical protein
VIADGGFVDSGIQARDGGRVEADAHVATVDAGPTCVAHDETCNEADDDCDGRVDEGMKLAAFFEDADGDGHGDPTIPGAGCTVPAGTVGPGDDCDDGDAARFPGAGESCNEIDDDCDAMVDEGVQTTFYRDGDGDGYGVDGTGVLACAPSADHSSTVGGDCDDTCASCHFGGVEVCDGRDQDCALGVDDGVMLVFYRDADHDGHGNVSDTIAACAAPISFVAGGDDCDDTIATVHPGATETCNHDDDDCDATTDEGLVTATYYVDADGDGFAANTGGSVVDCALPAGYTTVRPISGTATVDCFPAEARAFPGQTAYFTTPIAGAPITRAYDYNCDTSNSTRYGSAASCAGTAIDCSSPVTLPAFAGAAVTCGASGTLVTSCRVSGTPPGALTCGAAATPSTVQPCR